MSDIPTPIPLRTVTTLLNYERCIADEFRQQILEGKPTSVNRIHLHTFLIDSNEVTGTPSTNDLISSKAFPSVQSLSFSQREVIYHESRGHDGCYKAIDLYQQFFELCPPGQNLSIQIKHEAPVLVSPLTRRILEFTIKGPKLLTISAGMRGMENGVTGTIVTGADQQSLHSALGFARPGSRYVDFVVDMARMQWGEAGRGRYGELYYLGSVDGYYDIMKNVCEDLEELGIGATHVAPSPHTEAMATCAKRVWERWENRDKEGWCDYCGVGAAERRLSNCSGCQQTKARYCCKEHQVSAWKLHKFTCEKKK